MTYETMAAVATAVVETVQESGRDGAPSGILYAAVQTMGMSLNLYQSMMDALVHGGILARSGNVYRIA